MPTKELSYINYNGDTYTIIDSTTDSKYSQLGHSHSMGDITNGTQGIYYVPGTQTASTGAWTGNLSAVDSLYNGLTIAYYLPYAGSGNASLTLTLKNNVTTSAIPVYWTGTSRMTTHIGANSVIVLTYVDGAWRRADRDTNDNTIPATHVPTGAATQAKVGSHTYYAARPNSYTLVTLRYANSYAGNITLNINSIGAKPIYINGEASSASNYTLPAGTYLVYYDGDNYYFNTNGEIPHVAESIGRPNDWTWDKSKVSVSELTASGNKVGKITIDGAASTLYAPAYTGATPIVVTGTEISHATSGVTAATYGTTGTNTLSPNFGDSFSVPGFTVDNKGHITAAGAHNVSIPNLSVSNTLANTNVKIGTITINGTANDIYAQKYTADTPISISNAYKITHATSGPSSSGNTSKGDTTNQTPGFGQTFKALSATVDKYGHTTALAEHTVQIPSLPTNTNTPVYSNTSDNFLISTLTLNGTQSKIYIPNYPTAETLGLNRALKFIGFSTTAITDGQTSTPTISGVTGYTPAAGDVVIDGSQTGAASQWEYVYTTANTWERLGGDASYVIGGTTYDVTNGGQNAKSAVTISPKTTNIYSMTSDGSVTNGSEASLSIQVTNEKLSFTFTPNAVTQVTLPSRSSAIAAWTGYNTGVNNTYAAAQEFTPTQKTIQVN